VFVVDEATAEAIRRAYFESGELAAVVELRRHFPGITRQCERTAVCAGAIAGWQPLPPAAEEASEAPQQLSRVYFENRGPAVRTAPRTGAFRNAGRRAGIVLQLHNKASVTPVCKNL
jgi:hypothetical protein